MRIAARKDRNQDEIVKALRGAGAYVKPINHEGLFFVVCSIDEALYIIANQQ